MPRVAVAAIRAALAAGALLGAAAAWAGSTVAFDAALGAAWNVPSPLTIRQTGEAAVHLVARYDVRPFELPPYYRLRALLGGEGSDWSLELIHHKLYLANPPPEVQGFSISHGYNLALVTHGWNLGALWLRAGAGVVVAHPESTVRGRAVEPGSTNLGAGYHLAGGVLAISAERRIDLASWAYLALTALATGAYAEVPVAGGGARVPNLAAHALVAVGVRFPIE